MALSTIDTSSISALGYGFKNRIINGAMVISQRGNSPFTTTTTTSGNYCLDRWTSECSVASKFTVTQSSTAPAGFVSSALVTSSSAYPVGSGDYFTIEQRIEANNVADLGWGTASAQTVTLSFWVRSSLTGTFGGAVNNNSNYSYPFSYTISSANTWEQKTVTIAGPTSGTWGTGTALCINIVLGLGVGTTYSGTTGSWAGSLYLSSTGATSVVGTSGATFYITGVQLEKGVTATAYDYRPYGTELALCQRYYYKSYPQNIIPGSSGYGSTDAWVVDGSSLNRIFITNGGKFAVTMRVYPTTLVFYSEDGTVNNVSIYNNSAYRIAISSYPNPYDNGLAGYLQLSSSGATGTPYVFSFTASAEL